MWLVKHGKTVKSHLSSHFGRMGWWNASNHEMIIAIERAKSFKIGSTLQWINMN